MLEKNLELSRDDITLTGMSFIPEGNRKFPGVIVAHGLPGTPLPVEEKGYDELGRKICELGAVSTIFNFSGCKGSGGFFSIKNWVKDLNLITTYLRSMKEVNSSQIGFLAFSMGTIPTIYFAAHYSENSNEHPLFLIICASPADLSKSRLAELRVGIHLTSQQGGIRITKAYDTEILAEFKEYMPVNWINYVHTPKFILHGGRDELVNVKNAHSLYEKALDPRILIILKEAHHKLRQDEEAMKKILGIIKDFC